MKYWLLIVVFLFANLIFPDHYIHIDVLNSKIPPFVLQSGENLKITCVFSSLWQFYFWPNSNFKIQLTGNLSAFLLPKDGQDLSEIAKKNIFSLPGFAQQIAVEFVNRGPVLQVGINRFFHQLTLNVTSLPALEWEEPDWEHISSLETWELIERD
jgi:hypothetical protein